MFVSNEEKPQLTNVIFLFTIAEIDKRAIEKKSKWINHSFKWFALGKSCNENACEMQKKLNVVGGQNREKHLIFKKYLCAHSQRNYAFAVFATSSIKLAGNPCSLNWFELENLQFYRLHRINGEKEQVIDSIHWHKYIPFLFFVFVEQCFSYKNTDFF